MNEHHPPSKRAGRRSMCAAVPQRIPTIALLLLSANSGCGRSDAEANCIAYRYQVMPTNSIAVREPGSPQQELHDFESPSIIVNADTHQSIQALPLGTAAQRLRAILSDATREGCRRALEVASADFEFHTTPNNCNEYSPDQIEYSVTNVEASAYDDSPGDPIELNPVCHARCLLDDCMTGDTGGTFDPVPEHPSARTVRCKCQIEEVGECPPSPESPERFPAQTTYEQDFCVPSDRDDPAEYCRVDIADYLDASIRTINNYAGVHIGEYDESCGSFAPAVSNVKVECLPVDAHGNILDEATFAYTEQNDTCEPGCSALECNEIQNEGVRECQIFGDGDCDPPCSLSEACDCDLLPTECFEGEPIAGVCLPEIVGGADGGSDGGGGAPERLTSAINMLAGTWLEVAEDFTCSQVEPGGSLVANTSNPAPSSAVSSYALTNGTSFSEGLLHTCPAPAIDPVGLSTFGTTLEQLCRLVPLCDYSSDLSLTITASEDTTPLASGALTKIDQAITTIEAGAPLTTGDHVLDLCIDHAASGVEACSQQPIRASEPLGSGVDESGSFAGELALDFVPLAAKPEATTLTLTGDGIARVSLPSGFEFPFYGTTISDSLWVGANGGIDTSWGMIDGANTSVLSTGEVPDLAVYWDDLDPSAGGGVYTWFDGTRFIVSWEDVPHGRDEQASTSDGVNIQAHIHRSGRIEFHYDDTIVGDEDYDRGRSATVGVMDPMGLGGIDVSVDDSTLWSSGVSAIGMANADDGCLASELIIPPEVACTAEDRHATVCMPTGDVVDLPLPDVSACASGAEGITGRVVESGSSEAALVPLDAPIAIDPDGSAPLDEGVHRIEWRPIDALGEPIDPPFSQLAFVQTWVHHACGGEGRSLMVLTEGDDTVVTGPQPEALALVGLGGDDLLVSAAGDDFLGDGASAGICEAHGGNDLLVGEDGDDTLDSGSGDDRAWGGPGHDLLVGGSGHDHLDGQVGDDILLGDADDDDLWGGLGDDILEGGDGDDVLVPGAGVDMVYGGPGDDILMLLGSCELSPGMLLSGGSGTDSLLLPPGLELSDVVAAGVTVDPDIESVESSTELPTHRIACEPS